MSRRSTLALALVATFVAAVGILVFLVDDHAGDPLVLPRWVPEGADDVTISYGGWSPILVFSPDTQIALLTPHGDPAAPERTTVSRFTVSAFGGDNGDGASEHDGEAEVGWHVDGTRFWLRTVHFDGTWLDDHLTDLEGAGTELDAVAAVVAGWSTDLELAYVGEPLTYDIGVWEGDDTWNFVASTAERDPARRLATYGPDEDGSLVEDYFALDSAPPLGDTYLLIRDIPIRDETRMSWIGTLTVAIGDDPNVRLSGAGWWWGLVDPAEIDDGPTLPDVGDIELERWQADDDSWRIRLRFGRPLELRDGGAITVVIDDRVALAFEYVLPGMPHETLELGSRLYAEEAELLVDVVNDALG